MRLIKPEKKGSITVIRILYIQVQFIRPLISKIRKLKKIKLKTTLSALRNQLWGLSHLIRKPAS
jgi:hypothetical protein